MSTTTNTYARRLIESGRQRGHLPRYGTPAWEALPDTDPRRVAAVVIAAECWRREGTRDAVAARLENELAESRALALRLVREANRDLSEALREGVDWDASARRVGLPRTPEEWIADMERRAERFRAEIDAKSAERARARQQQGRAAA